VVGPAANPLFTAGVTGGTLEFHAAVGVEFHPSLLEDGVITLDELTSSTKPIGELVSFKPTGSFNANLPLTLNAGAAQVVTQIFGTPTVVIQSSDLFNGGVKIGLLVDLNGVIRNAFEAGLTELKGLGTSLDAKLAAVTVPVSALNFIADEIKQKVSF